MRVAWKLLVILGLITFLAGCNSLDLRIPGGQSETWQVALARKTDRDPRRYLQLRCDYERDTRDGVSDQTESEQLALREVRNEIISLQLQWIMQYHDMYLRDRVYGTSFSGDGLEIITLGTSAAATVVGGVVVKSALAGTSTVAGAIKSPLLNGLSRLRLTEAVLARMEINRAEAAKRIEQGRELPIDEYPLYEADEDLLEYFYSISPDKAAADLLNLSQNSGGNDTARRNEPKTTGSTMDGSTASR